MYSIIVSHSYYHNDRWRGEIERKSENYFHIHKIYPQKNERFSTRYTSLSFLFLRINYPPFPPSTRKNCEENVNEKLIPYELSNLCKYIRNGIPSWAPRKNYHFKRSTITTNDFTEKYRTQKTSKLFHLHLAIHPAPPIIYRIFLRFGQFKILPPRGRKRKKNSFRREEQKTCYKQKEGDEVKRAHLWAEVKERSGDSIQLR